MAPTLPPYTYLPGHRPHPHNDPEGHSYGVEDAVATELRLDDWRSCEGYQYGVWLFNQGYYWEAHEAWESVWRLMGRHGVEGQFLQALIKIAAVGIKVRQGHAKAGRSLLTQAAKHLERVMDKGELSIAGGIRLAVLERWCRDFRDEVGSITADATKDVEQVLPPLQIQLVPSE